MKQGRTLAELAQELERQDNAKVDYIADTRRMHFTSVTTRDPSPAREQYGAALSTIDLVGDGASEEASNLEVLDYTHRQIADYLSIPWRYYDRLRGQVPDLLDLNVNKLFHHQPERRMIRTLDGKARAFLSDRYRRLDNADLARRVLPILGQLPDCRIESCQLTDTRMYIKAIVPTVGGEIRRGGAQVGDEVCAGVFVSNSEVGHGKLRVEPFVYTLACTNGMVVSKELGGIALRRIHVGRRLQSDEETYQVFRDETLALDDQAFFAAVEDVVRAAVDEVRFRDLVEAMQAAADETPLPNMIAGVQELAAREDLNESEQNSVLTHLAQGGDLSRWGVLSAVTRAAEDADDYDRATELEELGGKILAYSPADWRTLVRAEA